MKSGLKILAALALLALGFNTALLTSVALNLEWAQTRAAGGQFDEFPVALRVIYLVMAIAMLYLMRFLVHLLQSEVTERQRRVARFLGLLFIVSTCAQLVSRSVDERWNAIPAATLAATFLIIAKRSQKK